MSAEHLSGCQHIKSQCHGGERLEDGNTDTGVFGAVVTSNVDAQCRWEEQGEDGLAEVGLHGY